MKIKLPTKKFMPKNLKELGASIAKASKAPRKPSVRDAFTKYAKDAGKNKNMGVGETLKKKLKY